MSLPFLETIGLTTKEAELYELLLRVGEVPAQLIIRESKLKRATAYKVLYSLETKGLVSKKDVGKIIHFRPESPTRLTELAETRHQELNRAREDIRALIPQLTSAYILAVEKPVVSTFEGIDGLKKIYEDTLREGKEILAVAQIAEIEPKLHEWLAGSYVKKRTKQKVFARVILSSSKESFWLHNQDKKQYRETRIVPQQKYPFLHEINVYGDKVAFLNHKKGGSLIGVLIKHPDIASTMKACFNLAWDGAEKYSSKQ